MKMLKPAILGIAPGAIGALGTVFYPAGDVLMAVVYVFGVACCFRGGFGVADQWVRSPGKNLVAGFSLTVLFFAINVCVLLAVAQSRSRSYE